MQREKIVSINGLRGFACLIIMLYHFRFYLLDKGVELIDYGHYFVEVFIMVSGFLMAYNYSSIIADMNFRAFWSKRYMKIMPLYWITEICVYIAEILATVLSGEKYEWNLSQTLWELSGFYTGWFGQADVPVNNPLWTVCCLFLCYALYFAICKVRKKSDTLYISMIIVIIISCFYYVNHTGSNYLFGSEDSLRCIISFMFGLLLYELYKKLTMKQGMIISYILIGIFVGSIVGLSYYQMISRIDMDNVVSKIVIFLFGPIMLYSAIYIKGLKFLFSSRIMQFIGKISMDIYMWHWVVRIYLGSRPFYVNQNTWSGWALLITVSLVVAVLSHYIVMPWVYGMGVKIKRGIGKI